MVENQFDNFETPIDFFGKWAETGKDKGMEIGHADSVKFMVNKILKNNNSEFTFLDIGCVNGWVVRMLNKEPKCTFSVGVDGAKQMIEKAKSIEPKGNYFCSDLLDWNSGRKFNIIHSMEVMYYFKEPLEIFNKIFNQWIENKGKFIFGIDHYLENESALNWPQECGVYMNTKSIIEWKDMVDEVGFKNIQTWQVGAKDDWGGTLIIYGEK